MDYYDTCSVSLTLGALLDDLRSAYFTKSLMPIQRATPEKVAGQHNLAWTSIRHA